MIDLTDLYTRHVAEHLTPADNRLAAGRHTLTAIRFLSPRGGTGFLETNEAGQLVEIRSDGGIPLYGPMLDGREKVTCSPYHNRTLEFYVVEVVGTFENGYADNGVRPGFADFWNLIEAYNAQRV